MFYLFIYIVKKWRIFQFFSEKDREEVKFTKESADKDTGAIKMNNGRKLTAVHGAGGTRGPQGPSKLPNLKQFLTALRASSLSPIRRLAVVYDPNSSLGQIKKQLVLEGDKGTAWQITLEILRRKLVKIIDLKAYAESPDAKERFIAAACEKLELGLVIDLVLDKKDHVSEMAKATFLQRTLSKAEVKRLMQHPEEKIRNILQEHDSYMEHSGEEPASALSEIEQPLVEGRDGVVQALIREMNARAQERTGRSVFLQIVSDSQDPQEPHVPQIAASYDLWYICFKPDKTARDYWTLLNALKETDHLDLASEIAHHIHKELFTQPLRPSP
jgi:hypothetical protein